MNLITFEEKNDGKEITQWNKNLVDIFRTFCVKNIKAGSKSGTHFDTKGWKQLIAEFTEATEKEYNRKQLRNKWDHEEWWAKKLAVSILKLSLVIPKAKKFRKEGIHPDFDATLDRMFLKTTATGEDAWTPSFRIVSSSIKKDTQPEDSEILI
ncbi:hypothetical protein HN873_066311 [Arachis hypogaea]